MKLKTKIIITILFFVIITTASITAIVVFDIKSKANESILRYEKSEMARVKQELKNIVDIAYDSANRNYLNAKNPDFVSKYYGHRLKNILDIAFSIISEKCERVKDQKLSIEEAQAESISLLKNLRYNNSGYIWINSTDWPYPKMIMHPVKPELDGEVLDSKIYNCAQGTNQNLFQAGVEKAVKDGDGFIAYKWDKPTKNGITPLVQKLSYVRLFAPWKWVLGVGVFVDEALIDAKANSEITIENMRYNNGAGYLFIINENLHCVMHPYDKDLENKDLANIADPDGVKLFEEMSKVCKNNKSGFVEYRWAKPVKDGTTIPRARKISYVRSFKPWGWIIGSGVYIDQIEKRMLAKTREINDQINLLIKKIITTACVILFIAIILSILFANTISAPILLLIKKLKAINISDLSNSKIELKGSYEIKELGLIFNETTEKLSEAIEELKKTTNAKEKIEVELNVARDIQLNIIPNLFPAFPNVPEFELFATIESAKAVGGDLYDFFMIDDTHLCFAIGDVSGKGVPASLFMAITHTLLRAKVNAKLPPNKIIQEMNKILCKDNNSCMFVTFLLCILDIKTGVVEYSNAGHNFPFIIQGQHKIEELKGTHGPPLGIIEDSEYELSQFTLAPSDTVFLYTDGVNEATNAQVDMFEMDRLKKALDDAKLLSPKGITDTISTQLSAFVGDAEQADDITMLTLTYRG